MIVSLSGTLSYSHSSREIESTAYANDKTAYYSSNARHVTPEGSHVSAYDAAARTQYGRNKHLLRVCFRTPPPELNVPKFHRLN